MSRKRLPIAYTARESRLSSGRLGRLPTFAHRTAPPIDFLPPLPALLHLPIPFGHQQPFDRLFQLLQKTSLQLFPALLDHFL
jgi:hypothetical protein